MTLRFDVPADVLDRARAGEAAATDRLIELAWPHAFRIAFSIVRDRDRAQDAAQEACAVAYRHVVRLRESAAFGVWFYRIVMRQATAMERKAVLRRAIDRRTPATNSPDESIARIDILNSLARLPRVRRACVILHFYAQMNSREIAAVLAIPDGTVRFHLSRARRELARMLAEDPPLPARRMVNAHAV
ncbi:MAG TPA: sigma-70 family RNA polymerase sigma factor [Candidatus Acidoferrales bacterium]|nr:sigma-70 family RNA polymerase sigma factor [Candidatus Acidoferrales bacterium]